MDGPTEWQCHFIAAKKQKEPELIRIRVLKTDDLWRNNKTTKRALFHVPWYLAQPAKNWNFKTKKLIQWIQSNIEI